MLTSVLSRLGLAAVSGAGPLVSILVPMLAEAVVTAIAQAPVASSDTAPSVGKPSKKGKRGATSAPPATDQQEESDHADHP